MKTEITLYEMIAELVNDVDVSKLNKVSTTTVIRNKKNHEEIVESIEEALEKGLNLVNYEKYTETSSPKFAVIEQIFGTADYKITKAERKVFEKLNEVIKVLAGKVVDVSPKENSDFNKKKISYTQKIARLEKDNKTTEVEVNKLVQLYIDSNIVPRTTFKYLSQYKEATAK